MKSGKQETSVKQELHLRKKSRDLKIPEAYVFQTVNNKEQKVPVEDIIEYTNNNGTITAVVKTRARTTVRLAQSIFIGDIYA